jgi:hypothetical protein
VTAGLLALTLAAAPPAGLQKGDQFTFIGTVAEAVQRAPDFFRRSHALELRILVIDRQETWADVAVLTRLQRKEDAVGGAVGVVTGAGPRKDAPPSIRLDLVRVHADGTVHLLSPPGPPPLKLAAETPARALPPLPLDTFAASEFGVFAPRPPAGNSGEPWTVAAPGNRPAETWQAKSTEFVNAERCRLLIGNQMSADWEKPVGGQTAWHRADAVWVSTHDGTARKVHRVIKQRDGKAAELAAWVEVKYELHDQSRLGGRTFDRARSDFEVAYAALADAARLVPDAAKLGPQTFETRVRKLDAQIEEADPTSPYREVMLSARRALDAARRGKAAPVSVTPAPTAPAPVAPAKAAWPEPGQVAPDVKAGPFRLADHRDKPVVLVFFRPGGETTDLSLAIADALAKRYEGKVVVAPLVVFGTTAAGVKDRDRLKFTVPVYDGSAAVAAYGVETAPRFAIVGTDGTVRWTFTGVGGETGFLVKEQLDRLVGPASPAGATATTHAPGPPGPDPLPRP